MTDLQSEILAGTSYQDVPPFAKLYLKGLGASEERERIIKLLEDNLYFSDWEGIFRKTGGLQVDVQDIIALIKGEK